MHYICIKYIYDSPFNIENNVLEVFHNTIHVLGPFTYLLVMNFTKLFVKYRSKERNEIEYSRWNATLET